MSGEERGRRREGGKDNTFMLQRKSLEKVNKAQNLSGLFLREVSEGHLSVFLSLSHLPYLSHQPSVYIYQSSILIYRAYLLHLPTYLSIFYVYHFFFLACLLSVIYYLSLLFLSQEALFEQCGLSSVLACFIAIPNATVLGDKSELPLVKINKNLKKKKTR